MAGDAPFFIGEAIPEEKTRCNGQRNDDEKVVRLIRCMVDGPYFTSRLLKTNQTSRFHEPRKA
jgi:hypothetical protein